MFGYEYDSDNGGKSYKQRKAERPTFYKISKPNEKVKAFSRKEAAQKMKVQWFEVKELK